MGGEFFLLVVLNVIGNNNKLVLAQGSEVVQRQCEPIRIEMCRNLGYNETSMPNFAGNEIQSDAEYTLQSFSPLIEYVCSSQLKLFLCATYVPMCTPKAPIPIGPCRTLCENVRSRCDPVLQGFGYPWPPALDCNVFPKENNQETMCMEGPGEAQDVPPNEILPGQSVIKEPSLHTVITNLECPGLSKNYVKLHRSWRCVPLCEANILFEPNEKRVAEIWANTWTYAALGLSLLALVCQFKAGTEMANQRERVNSRVLAPHLLSHTMVTIGWTVRFVAGRIATSCGYHPQLPNISLLLVDGLSNGPCAVTFILRYYFGMTASAWWAIFCLDWHRDVRRNSPDVYGQFLVAGSPYAGCNISRVADKALRKGTSKTDKSIANSNLAKFLAWGLPAFQTAAVIVARLVDADELLGTCYVGNQSDKGLQIYVATPLFCYWIFGSMNLASGFLVHRRNREILSNTNISSVRVMLESTRSISGTFLFLYCLPYATLLMAVIYEFANIDVWLNVASIRASRTLNSETLSSETPMWPFLTRTFMELMLAIICSAWVLGPKMSSIYKNKYSRNAAKIHVASVQAQSVQQAASASNLSFRTLKKSTSLVLYQSVRQPRKKQAHVKHHSTSAIIMKSTSGYDTGRSNKPTILCPTHKYVNAVSLTDAKSVYQYGKETTL